MTQIHIVEKKCQAKFLFACHQIFTHMGSCDQVIKVYMDREGREQLYPYYYLQIKSSKAQKTWAGFKPQTPRILGMRTNRSAKGISPCPRGQGASSIGVLWQDHQLAQTAKIKLPFLTANKSKHNSRKSCRIRL